MTFKKKSAESLQEDFISKLRLVRKQVRCPLPLVAMEIAGTTTHTEPN